MLCACSMRELLQVAQARQWAQGNRVLAWFGTTGLSIGACAAVLEV
jgi:hypothetical protein